ncbi:unnamed protein product [Caenorhabditis sp. 36 PRJEB53466]|nr:unnamed protein product [Caenorhabditis sp. 36 PRJEB53466]
MCAPGNQDESDDTKALHHAIHKGIYEWFGIDFTHFGRTTTGQQTEICQDMFLKLHENRFTSTQSVDQLFCNKCDKFLADRFVTGTCPMCAYDDARGDQTRSVCKGPPEVKQSTHIFLSLEKLQQKTTDHLDKELAKEDNRWSANAVGITRAWMKLGLDPRCITRDLKGGPGGPGGYNEGQGGAGGFPEGPGGFQGGAGGAGNGAGELTYEAKGRLICGLTRVDKVRLCALCSGIVSVAARTSSTTRRTPTIGGSFQQGNRGQFGGNREIFAHGGRNDFGGESSITV